MAEPWQPLSAPGVHETNGTLEHPETEGTTWTSHFLTGSRASPNLDASQGSIHPSP